VFASVHGETITWSRMTPSTTFSCDKLLMWLHGTLAEEAERILECQGRVFCLEDEPGVHRVWLPDEESPGLAMSRAFGDYCVKEYGLISVPEVTHRNITSRDQFVVLATDGVLYHTLFSLKLFYIL